MPPFAITKAAVHELWNNFEVYESISINEFSFPKMAPVNKPSILLVQTFEGIPEAQQNQYDITLFMFKCNR